MIILGIVAYTHDSAACLLKDGEVLAFIEEERLNREKHTTAFPYKAISTILEMGPIEFSDIDHICYFSQPWREISQNLGHFIRYFPKTLNLFSNSASGAMESGFLSAIKEQMKLRSLLAKKFPIDERQKISFFPHHLCHAASAYYMSPFQDAAILTLDGRGESTTTLMADAQGGKIEVLKSISVPHSLGHLYAAITEYLGFKSFNDEWKVMGLSAYGGPSQVKFFEKLIEYKGRGNFELNLDYFQFHTHGQDQWLSDLFYEEFGPKRNPDDEITPLHQDYAFALQYMTELIGLELSRYLKDRTGRDRLCLAGGVALNCLMNSRIIEESGFSEVFVQPIAGDAGTALGACLLKYQEGQDSKISPPLADLYWGPSYKDEQLEEALKKNNLNFERPASIEEAVAEEIDKGQVICWFQGKMEAGPRALGNRSILADPRRKDMKDILNEKVKKREYFRPFAPSVTEEDYKDYFEIPGDQLSPYMILTGKVKNEAAPKIPAVTHVDQTARIQTVNEKQNPKYHKLIKAFQAKTGVPVLLNTSFNENEPIVCSPQDAIDCFLRTEIDVLALGPYLVMRKK